MINCRLFADGNYRLVGDLDVVCYSDEHMFYANAAYFFIFFYPVGVPFSMLFVLVRNKSDLFEVDPDNPGQMRPTEEPKFNTTKHLSGMYVSCLSPHGCAPRVSVWRRRSR